MEYLSFVNILVEMFKHVQNPEKFYSFKDSTLHQFKNSPPLEARQGQVGDLQWSAVKELIPELPPWGIWRFDHIFWLRPHLVGDVMHPAYCLWLSIPHSFLALETPHFPFLPKIISEPISHTSQELRSKVGAAPYTPIMVQFSLHASFSHYPSNLEFHHILFIYWLTPLFLQQCSLSTCYGSVLLC